MPTTTPNDDLFSDNPPPFLTGIVEAAKRAGLSRKFFLSACDRGEIPVPLQRIGRRFFVETHPFERWISSDDY